MMDEETNEDAREARNSEEEPAAEAWREVGRRFEALGESLSKALRAAWQSEETQRHVQSMEEGLDKVTDEIDRAVRDATESPQGEKLRQEAEKTAESVRVAGEQTWRDARPRLISALKRFNAEIETAIERLEEKSGERSTNDVAEDERSGVDE